jgi:Xaa-Pro aminopeptidase
MKLREFQSYLSSKKIDLSFFAHPDPTITYFTQMKPSYAFLLITPTTASLHLTKLDHKPTIKHITTKIIDKNWTTDLSNKKIKIVGINKETITLSFYEKLKKLYPRAKFVDIAEKLHQLRSQKTTDEIKKISEACKITSNAFNLVVSELSKNTLKTEQDVADFLEKKMRNQNGSLAFPTIVAMGKNAATPHHVTSNNKLNQGFLLMDFGACYENYCADMTRVVFLGKPNKSERTYYDLLLKSQQNAINEIEEKKSFMQLDKVARETLKDHSKFFTHSLGHGIGVEVHEAPTFSQKGQNIQKNQVFTVEPGIYFPNKFGLRIEDTILFNGKTKVLTTASKELISIKRP